MRKLYRFFDSKALREYFGCTHPARCRRCNWCGFRLKKSKHEKRLLGRLIKKIRKGR